MEDNKFKGLRQHCDEVEEVMGQTPPWIFRWGIMVIAILMSGLFMSCWFIQWPEQMTAGGTLVADDKGGILELNLMAEQVRQLRVGMKVYVTIDVKDDSWGNYETSITTLPYEKDSVGAYLLRVHLSPDLTSDQGHTFRELLKGASSRLILLIILEGLFLPAPFIPGHLLFISVKGGTIQLPSPFGEGSGVRLFREKCAAKPQMHRKIPLTLRG